MPIFLHTSIDICEKIEKGEIKFNAVPYVDPKTNYLISILPKCDYAEWSDCTPNNQPDWDGFQTIRRSSQQLVFKKQTFPKNLFYNKLNTIKNKILMKITITANDNGNI